MNVENALHERSGSSCELCTSKLELSVYGVPPESDLSIDKSILICTTCKKQIEEEEPLQPDHWRCLNDSMWNTLPAVQVVVYRMLHKLKAESWPVDLLDMMYMEDSTLDWAKSILQLQDTDSIVHKDSNGNVLAAGDTVVLIKDLKVKGASFVAKQGTAVRRISLVADNPEHIEGKIEGQRIVILTQYVKKMK